jgi:ferrochelatase
MERVRRPSATIDLVPRLDPYDAVLLLSFGGPEGPEDVMPFLENVTRGRGIPPERLKDVATHYDAVGGKSPINDQNRALLAALRSELDRRGVQAPIGWGNRNWAPYVVGALRDLHEAGARRVVVVTTSAYSSYSSCRQYREDLADAVTMLAGEGRLVEVDRVRAYYDHPGFAGPATDAVLRALAELPERLRDDARLVFVTHSIPLAMNEGSGPAGNAYRDQHLELAGEIAQRVATATGRRQGHDLTYCSRSGPPSQAWLEPDVNDHLRALAEAGEKAVVVFPIGFVSDHLEVIWDLDNEAAETAQQLGLAFARAATAGTHPAFVATVRELLQERRAGGEPRLGTSCPASCCFVQRPSRPSVP